MRGERWGGLLCPPVSTSLEDHGHGTGKSALNSHRPIALDYGSTLMLAIELSNRSWVLAAQVPGPWGGFKAKTLCP